MASESGSRIATVRDEWRTTEL
jgi:hypothetical protein